MLGTTSMNNFTQNRILVTGGAGFLGSYLCERLLREHHSVLCVDNFYTGTRRNVSHLLDNPDFELLRHDITFPLFVEVDEIYNLACPASPIHYQYDPVQTTKVNVHGSIIIDLTGSGSKIIMKSLPEDDPGNASLTLLAKEILGFTPVTTLEEGLRMTIAYFEDLLNSHHPRSEQPVPELSSNNDDF